MARVYNRDANGRFASGGGSSSKGRPATTKASMRGGQNRLTRDNSGRITSIGGNGATARGGRLRTAAGNQRGRQVASVKGGGVKGAVSKNKRRDPNTPVLARRAEPKAQEFRIPKAPGRKNPRAKTADDLLTQATRIDIKTRAASRRAPTGARSRVVEERGAKAVAAAKSRAFALLKPKPLSKTAQAKADRQARVKAREQQQNSNRLIREANMRLRRR